LQKHWGQEDLATALLAVPSPVTGEGLTIKIRDTCLGNWIPFFAGGE